jgi:hypothetical protein
MRWQVRGTGACGVAKNGGFSRHPQVHIRQGNDCHTTDGVIDQMGQLGIPIIDDYRSDE